MNIYVSKSVKASDTIMHKLFYIIDQNGHKADTFTKKVWDQQESDKVNTAERIIFISSNPVAKDGTVVVGKGQYLQYIQFKKKNPHEMYLTYDGDTYYSVYDCDERLNELNWNSYTKFNVCKSTQEIVIPPNKTAKLDYDLHLSPIEKTPEKVLTGTLLDYL